MIYSPIYYYPKIEVCCLQNKYTITSQVIRVIITTVARLRTTVISLCYMYISSLNNSFYFSLRLYYCTTKIVYIITCQPLRYSKCVFGKEFINYRFHSISFALFSFIEQWIHSEYFYLKFYAQFLPISFFFLSMSKCCHPKKMLPSYFQFCCNI